MYGSEFVPSIHILKILSGYPFFNSELKLGKSNKSNNPGMEVQFKRAFKTCYFLSPKKGIQKQTPHKKFYSTPNTSVQQLPQSPISNTTLSLFCCPPFSKEYLNSQVRINKMVVLVTTSPSGLTSRIHPLILL